MLIDEIKKANMQALKDKDKATRAALSTVINKYMLLNVENKAKGKETTDADVISILQKSIKELEEEAGIEIFRRTNRGISVTLNSLLTLLHKPERGKKGIIP